jgi:hypothetical protein
MIELRKVTFDVECKVIKCWCIICIISFSRMQITSELLETDTWNLVQTYILKIPVYCAWNVCCSSVISTQTTAKFSVLPYRYYKIKCGSLPWEPCNFAGNPRPYIPAPLRYQVFQAAHDLSHPGIKATAKLVAQRFMWPGIQRDCHTWARACQACQRSKAALSNAPPAIYFSGALHKHIIWADY